MEAVLQFTHTTHTQYSKLEKTDTEKQILNKNCHVPSIASF